MIASTVRLYHPMPPSTGAKLCKFIDESPINVWLLANVGNHARYKDSVTEQNPWHVSHHMAYMEYSFAREQDATMFALKFA